MQREIKVLLTADMMFTAALGLLGPIYAIFVSEIGGNVLAASSAWAGFAFTTGFITLLVSRYEDSFPKKGLLVVGGYLIKTVGVAGYFFVGNPLQLLLVQITLGLGSAIGYPAFDQVYSSHLSSKRGCFEWGLYESFYSIFTAVAAIIGGIIVTYFGGFTTLFAVMLLLSVFGTVVATHLVYRKKHIIF